MKKIKWGVLSTAKIGVEKVIPAMQKGSLSEVVAIASRNAGKAGKAAKRLGIDSAYGSYEELLADPNVEAVYNPLPNNLHVPWTLKCLEAGKHVLCEKPIGMNLKETEDLQTRVKKFPHLKVMEAFMYRFHPQWETIRRLLADNAIGELMHIHAIFTYYNTRPEDIRNSPGTGGGGLLDIGCYCISVARFIFGGEPHRVCGSVDIDPTFAIDRRASGVLEFGNGTSSFTCATQIALFQRADLHGTLGRIEIELPFNPSPVEPTSLLVCKGEKKENILIDPIDQYTLQGDAFSRAILDGSDVPTPLSDGIANMRVIDAVFRSAREGHRVTLNQP